jgi:hypothetical protein
MNKLLARVDNGKTDLIFEYLSRAALNVPDPFRSPGARSTVLMNG